LFNGLGTHWLPEAVEQRKEDLDVVVGGVNALGTICEIREIVVQSALGLALI
jgi:hypothetical protein